MRTLPARTFLLALIAALPLPAFAETACVGITLTGAAGPTIFLDGFESGDTLAWTQPAPPSFSTSATVDLAVEVELASPPPGEHLLELRWLLPGGALYQSATLPFSADAAPPGAQRRIPGYPFPAALRPVGRVTRAPGVEVPVVATALAVAGSSIVDAGLWGAWQVEARLDGEAAPCSTALFRMEP